MRLSVCDMPSPLAHAHAPAPVSVRVRNAERGDIDALIELEQSVFASDRLSRRSLQRFLCSRTAQMVVAEEGGALAGAAVLLFRPKSTIARLYSIAVAPEFGGRGIAALLLDAAEHMALARGCCAMRLEVHETNHAAISRYRKSGYSEFGRHRGYYENGGDALRFEKPLAATMSALQGDARRPRSATVIRKGPSR
jgi:ribosomal protein S18 acetylase RimI-like enzyme